MATPRDIDHTRMPTDNRPYNEGVSMDDDSSRLDGVVKTTGLEVQPWRGVAYAAGFAAAVFLITSLLMRRHLAASPHAGPEGATQ